MTLFLTLLPLYLLGNIHCFGMCGPLVLLIGRHKYRNLYFLGRTLSFALAGMLAGEVGALFQQQLAPFHLSAFVSIIFGFIIILLGLLQLRGGVNLTSRWLEKRLTILMLQEGRLPLFLFGFFTILLPCGQTLIVFSACALAQDPFVGLFNGAAFALLTSPSLWLAMRAHKLFAKAKQYHTQLLASCALVVGILACARGFADLDLIHHLILSERWHLVIY